MSLVLRSLQLHHCALKFQQCENEPCVFVKKFQNGFIIIVIYVDDLLLISKVKKETDTILEEFKQRFNIKFLGNISTYLSMTIT